MLVGIVGPSLPPSESAKRKREDNIEAAVEARHSTSPPSPSSNPTSTDKRRRILGPSLPPGPLDERPDYPPESDNDDSSSSSEGAVGPALPSKKDITVCEP